LYHWLQSQATNQFGGKSGIDLIHLKNNVVGYTSLCQQHVQLARHPTSNGMDTKTNIFPLFSKDVNQLCQRVLGLCNTESITRGDDDVLGNLGSCQQLL